jgi:hypothetical protein
MGLIIVIFSKLRMTMGTENNSVSNRNLIVLTYSCCLSKQQR